MVSLPTRSVYTLVAGEGRKPEDAQRASALHKSHRDGTLIEGSSGVLKPVLQVPSPGQDRGQLIVLSVCFACGGASQAQGAWPTYGRLMTSGDGTPSRRRRCGIAMNSDVFCFGICLSVASWWPGIVDDYS